MTRDTRTSCGTANWCCRQALCWLWASPSTPGHGTEHCAQTHTAANGPLATPGPQGWATHSSQWLLGQQKGQG